MAFGYEMVLGKPLMFWVGVTGLLLLLAAACCGFMVMKGKAKMQHHKWLAIAAVALGILHGIMAMSLYL